MIALLFIIGSFFMGTAVVKKLFPFATVAEKILWGLVSGLMISTWAAYIVCRISGNISFIAMFSITVLTWITGAALSFRDIKNIGSLDYKALLKENAPLILVLLLFLPVFLYFFLTGMFQPKPDGYFLTSTSWYDLCLHLAIATGFLYGNNFPPEYMVMPPEPLRYPFLPDFQAAVLMNLGFDIWTTFALTSIIMGIALTGIFYCFARRLVDSKIISILSTIIFLLNGGFGFLYFFEDWRKSKFSFLDFFFNMEQNYTDWLDQGIRWSNIITSGIIPQRAMLYGMPLGFMVLSLIAITWRQWSETEDEKRWDGAKILISAGVMTGLLPLFHTHSYMALGFISCFLFLVKPRMVWIAYWLPAVALALPQLWGLGSHVSSGTFMKYQPGWLSYLPGNYLLVLINNFGIPFIFIIPALIKAPKYLRSFYTGFIALFLLCMLFTISQNEMDNSKFFYYWYSVTAIIFAHWIYNLAREHKQYFLASLLFFMAISSGILAIQRETKLILIVFNRNQIAAAEFIKNNTPAKSLFLTSQVSNHPALCLAGRKILLGFEFWIKSHGYKNFEQRKKDTTDIFAGKANAFALLQDYNIDYIYLDSNEIKDLKANPEFFDRNFASIYKNNDITIYDIHKKL
jgi:hypothetical protein